MTTLATAPGTGPAGPAVRTRRRGGVLSSVLRTLASAVATVVVASFVIFTALSLAPGDPVSQILGARATAEQRAAVRAELGLDRPVLLRYLDWLTGVLHGDLGSSIVFRTDVSSLLGPRAVTTAVLVGLAAVLIAVFGIGGGALAGSDPRWRTVVGGLSGLAIAVPGFVAASLLISVFAVQLGWFPTFGAGQGLGDRLRHTVLPAVALSLGYGAYLSQITAASVSGEAGRDHVWAANGRGLPRALVFRRHVLRNAAIPVITASGLTVAGLIAGSVVVETAFSIDGLGSLLVKSISSKDYEVVTAISLLIVIAFVVATTLIDLLHVALDPRLRKD